MAHHFQLNPASSFLYFDINEVWRDGENETMEVHGVLAARREKIKSVAVKWNDQRFYRPYDSHLQVLPSDWDQ